MTTIAFRDGVLASDSRETMEGSGGSIWIVRDDDDEKIFRLALSFDPDLREGANRPPPPRRDYLFAGAHISSEIEMIKRALLTFTPLDEIAHEFCEVECLLIDCETEKMWYTDGLQWAEMKAPYVALGSGAPHALSAMDADCDAYKAVQMGIKRDPFSGGKVRTLRTDKATAALAAADKTT